MDMPERPYSDFERKRSLYALCPIAVFGFNLPGADFKDYSDQPVGPWTINLADIFGFYCLYDQFGAAPGH